MPPAIPPLQASALLGQTLIRDVPGFPKPGILFKDITPVLQNPDAFREIIAALIGRIRVVAPDATAIAAVESRGFLFGAPLALELSVPFIPVRKAGKLPHAVHAEEYALEYDSATVEIHSDSLAPDQAVILIDDLLATGGTARAAARLIERCGAKVAACLFVIELEPLKGRAALDGYTVESLIRY